VQAYRFEGKRYDCGSKFGYLQATVEYALQHPDLGEPFLEYLESVFGSDGKYPLCVMND
jgi:UTP--glucose-1-phosphate uridylyltransferase